MVIFEWLFTFLVIYFLYKLIFNFILPVSRATSEVRNKINEMNRQQQQSSAQQQQPSDFSATNSKTTTPPADEYIDFEEIK